MIKPDGFNPGIELPVQAIGCAVGSRLAVFNRSPNNLFFEGNLKDVV